MSVLITSCGRTGTNMLLEILRASDKLVATDPAEDKAVYRRGTIEWDNYLSKTDTHYISNYEYEVRNLLDSNKHLKILWTIRDLRDCSLSKIYRGQPGNDTGVLSDDATEDGCFEDINWMQIIHEFITKNYPERIMTVKLEDIILDFEKTIKEICNFIEIDYIEDMKKYVSRYRNDRLAKRYKKLDKNQIELYKRRYKIYDGFFKNHDIDLDLLFTKLIPHLKYFGYKL
tara:strand:+ start:903 stop:1589 length:687 start_codon:yes stop_codon:yes gene_type:complete